MGNYPAKTEVEPPEKRYLRKALQVQDNVENLEYFLHALVHSLDSQASNIASLQAELQHLRSEVADLKQNKDLPATKRNTDSKVQKQLQSGSDEVPDSGNVQHQYDNKQWQRNIRPGSASGYSEKSHAESSQERDIENYQHGAMGFKDGRPMSGKNKKKSQGQYGQNFTQGHGSSLDSDLYSVTPASKDIGKISKKRNRQDHSFVSRSPDDAVLEGATEDMCMEVDQEQSDIRFGSHVKNEDAVKKVSVAENVSTHIFDALVKCQYSTKQQANGILGAVQNLHDLISKELPTQVNQGIKASPENVTLQINLPADHTVRPTPSILIREQEIQTDIDKNYMTNIIENSERMRSLEESNDRILRSKDAEIERLERELASTTSRGRSAYSVTPSRWSYNYKPPRGKATVQIYCHRRTDKIDQVNVELEAMLKTQFDSLNYDLMCITCDKKDQLQANVPVIVLCINASRLGTDVQVSIEGLNVTKKIAVVILHHKDTHALPKQPSSRILTGTEYKALGGLFDMAFLANKGVYPCDMNQNTLSELVTFIQT